MYPPCIGWVFYENAARRVEFRSESPNRQPGRMSMTNLENLILQAPNLAMAPSRPRNGWRDFSAPSQEALSARLCVASPVTFIAEPFDRRRSVTVGRCGADFSSAEAEDHTARPQANSV
jgi:hypothetical protein